MKTTFILLLSLCVFARLGSAQDAGPIKATTKIRGDGSTATTIVNPETRTAEETLTDPKGKVLRKVTYILDDRDFSIAAIYYGPTGQTLYKASYTRDQHNRVTESRLTSADGKYLGRQIFTYYPNNKTRVDNYDANDQLMVEQKSTGPGRPDKKRR